MTENGITVQCQAVPTDKKSILCMTKGREEYDTSNINRTGSFLASIDEYTFGASMMGRPLFTAPFVGLILGDLESGIIIGATLESMFMGSIMVGSATPLKFMLPVF